MVSPLSLLFAPPHSTLLHFHKFAHLIPRLLLKKYKSEVCSLQSRSASTLQDAFHMVDADFFSDEKMVDIMKEASEFNLPITKANRKLVATSNGGLKNPSVLVFRPDWGAKEAEPAKKSFSYPSSPDMQRPAKEEDIAFMSIIELGKLIEAKKISSVELTEIFLKRLKRSPAWDSLWIERHNCSTTVQDNLGLRKFQRSSA
ncbi:Glutamyl-tRNA(Gln) amidotransferase subunit A [Bienertia sinuspersici]